MLLGLYPQLSEETFTLTFTDSITASSEFSVSVLCDIAVDDLVVQSDSLTCNIQSEINLNDLVEILSSCECIGEVLIAISDTITVNDTLSGQSFLELNNEAQISTYSDIKASISTGIRIDEIVTIEDLIKAFQYFKIRNWVLNNRAFVFTIKHKQQKFNMNEHKKIMKMREREKQWSLVNRNTTQWKLMAS